MIWFIFSTWLKQDNIYSFLKHFMKKSYKHTWMRQDIIYSFLKCLMNKIYKHTWIKQDIIYILSWNVSWIKYINMLEWNKI